MSSPTSSAEHARHYGNMQFAMFTVFTAISGALASFPFSDGAKAFIAIPSQRVQLALCGLILSVLFTLAQWRVTSLVHVYQESAFSNRELAKPDDHRLWKSIVKVTMIAPYIMSFLFWMRLCLGCITLQ